MNRPAWRIPARTFQILNARSADDWLACPDCIVYVRSKDWDGLTVRVGVVWAITHGQAMSQDMIGVVRMTYARLEENMIGSPVKL